MVHSGVDHHLIPQLFFFRLHGFKNHMTHLVKWPISPSNPSISVIDFRRQYLTYLTSVLVHEVAYTYILI